MIKAENADRQRIIDILILSFERNKSVMDVVGDRSGRTGRLKYLVEYALNICSVYGRVMMSEDKNACALVFFPERKRFTLKTLYWDLKLVYKVIGLVNLPRVLKREMLIKKQHFLKRTYYIWFIGVIPSRQSQGLGTKLLKELITDAKANGRPAFLETSVPKNVSWYKEHGFEIYHQIDLGYHLYFMNYFH